MGRGPVPIKGGACKRPRRRLLTEWYATPVDSVGVGAIARPALRAILDVWGRGAPRGLAGVAVPVSRPQRPHVASCAAPVWCSSVARRRPASIRAATGAGRVDAAVPLSAVLSADWVDFETGRGSVEGEATLQSPGAHVDVPAARVRVFNALRPHSPAFWFAEHFESTPAKAGDSAVLPRRHAAARGRITSFEPAPPRLAYPFAASPPGRCGWRRAPTDGVELQLPHRLIGRRRARGARADGGPVAADVCTSGLFSDRSATSAVFDDPARWWKCPSHRRAPAAVFRGYRSRYAQPIRLSQPSCGAPRRGAYVSSGATGGRPTCRGVRPDLESTQRAACDRLADWRLSGHADARA